MTQLLIQFCNDSQKMILFDHLDRFRHGVELPNGGEHEARGAARILNEIATLELAHIRQFYDVKDPAESQDNPNE